VIFVYFTRFAGVQIPAVVGVPLAPEGYAAAA